MDAPNRADPRVRASRSDKMNQPTQIRAPATRSMKQWPPIGTVAATMKMHQANDRTTMKGLPVHNSTVIKPMTIWKDRKDTTPSTEPTWSTVLLCS